MRKMEPKQNFFFGPTGKEEKKTYPQPKFILAPQKKNPLH